MKTKQIVFTEKDTARLLAAEYQSPENDEVTVRLCYTAISPGTEKANLTGIPNIQVGIREDDEAVFPRKTGYSGVGIVEAVGSSVTKVKEGDRVIVFWGCHMGRITVNQKQIVKIEDDTISMQEAALVFISTFPAAAIRKTHLEFGESVVVMGLGTLGQFAVRLCRMAGAYPVIAVDPVKERREFAIKGGADYALDPTEPNFVQSVKQLTNGGARVAIEVTGIGKGLEQALDCMARFGRVALLGCTRNSDFRIDYYNKVHGPGITLVGAHTAARASVESSYGNWTHEDDILAVLNLLRGNRLSYSDMIWEIHDPSEAPEVYQRLIHYKTFPPGVLFDWSKVNAEN